MICLRTAYFFRSAYSLSFTLTKKEELRKEIKKLIKTEQTQNFVLEQGTQELSNKSRKEVYFIAEKESAILMAWFSKSLLGLSRVHISGFNFAEKF